MKVRGFGPYLSMPQKALAMIGRVIADKYELVEVIGRGGMGTVFKAIQQNLNRDVAVKILSEDLASNADFSARFEQEATVVARLSHPNIVAVIDTMPVDDTFAIVMEFVEGESLQVRIDREGCLMERDACLIGAQIARALDHAHTHGVVHRDVKPDNILVMANGTAKITDFGIARFSSSKLKTQTGISMGTPKFMSPEQVTGKNIDGQSDLYSLGVCLYASLAGRVPFDGDNPITIATKHLIEAPVPPSEINTMIQPSVEKVIMRALEKQKEVRWATGNEMADALEALWERPKTVIRKDGAAIPTPKDSTRRMPSQTTPFPIPNAQGQHGGSTPPRGGIPTPGQSVGGDALRSSNTTPPPRSSNMTPQLEELLPPPEAIPTPVPQEEPHPMTRWKAILALLVLAALGFGGWYGFHALSARGIDVKDVVNASRLSLSDSPGRQFEITQNRATELAQNGKIREALAAWNSFAEKFPEFRTTDVNIYRDRLISKSAQASDVTLLADRRDRRGMWYFNANPPRPRMAKAYLEGAADLYNSLQRPFPRASHLSLLDRELSTTRLLITPKQLETSATIALQTSQKVAAEIAAHPGEELPDVEALMVQAIESDPENYGYWLQFADYYRQAKLRDDARVLYRFIEKYAPEASEVRAKASRALREM